VLLPIELDGFERGEFACKLSAQAAEEVQCFVQVAHLVHQVDPSEVGHAIDAQALLVSKPFAERAMSRGCGLV
jgi:hypothetical protein